MRYKQEVSIADTIETICQSAGVSCRIIGTRSYDLKMSFLLSGDGEISKLMPLISQIELETSLTHIRFKKTNIDGIVEMLGGA